MSPQQTPRYCHQAPGHIGASQAVGGGDSGLGCQAAWGVVESEGLAQRVLLTWVLRLEK